MEEEKVEKKETKAMPVPTPARVDLVSTKPPTNLPESVRNLMLKHRILA